MIKVSANQSLQRWDLLPEALREALASETNSTILWKICEDEHLPEEKIRVVAKIAGYVLLGFLHPEEAAREIRDRLGINPEVAANISKALDSRIFSRIRGDLNRIYAPAGEEPLYTPPKTLEEIRRPTEAPEPALVSEGKAIPSKASPIREPETSFEEKPIILHEEAESEPGKPATGFKLEAPPPKFEEVGEKFTPPMRPARLEIGTDLRTPPTPRIEQGFGGQAPATKPLMSPEQELPSPPQPVKEVNIRAEEIKINMTPMPIQKKRRGFWGWLKSLFSRKSQKEIVFTPKVISEEELKREALTIKASMPKPPSPPPRPSEPFRAPAPQPPPAPGPRPTRGPLRREASPSVFEEVVDLSTLTKTKKPFPPQGDSNTLDLKNNSQKT